jgi:hypothetical protein
MIQALTYFAAEKCSHFLGFPTWYEYIRVPGGSCSEIQITNINDVWLIVAAVVEILLRVAGIFAVAFVMYGGFQYITSQAEPEKVNRAKNTIINGYECELS